MFPADLGIGKLYSVPAVYNLVLEGGAPAEVDGVMVATLGHTEDGPVIGHPYFGSHAVLHDLGKMDGWQQGLVEVNFVVRSGSGSLIEKME